ncbi:MAG TPA: YdjY domain-containing protein [Isosphaeraceae bacterium]|jgi:hypothetical protein|nr:YdjY domain-containing protein [Isosphaeraceae bacterium]
MLTAMLLVIATLAFGSGPQGQDEPQAPADTFKPDPSWKPQGPGLWFDPSPKGRRVVIRARVALTEGALEHLLCLKNTKEHEAILATPAPPVMIKACLILTGAKEGHPVRYKPQFQPPAGDPIAIDLEWEADGKTQHARARDWVKDERTGKPLDKDWVFAGSEEYTDPVTKQTIFAANDGDLITVSNFPSALLDLPFASTSDDADRTFVANTKAIPPKGTFVTMYLHTATPAQPAKGSR